ncbi:MAG: hypothetical protein KDH96_09560, partial [Candidatus Riesia sp.]|nr:hypothetical protein [Candidatus Riesia sp.]
MSYCYNEALARDFQYLYENGSYDHIVIGDGKEAFSKIADIKKKFNSGDMSGGTGMGAELT